MNNKNWSVLLGLFQVQNKNCLLFLLFALRSLVFSKKEKKRLCYRLSQIEFENTIQNIERITSNLNGTV